MLRSARDFTKKVEVGRLGFLAARLRQIAQAVAESSRVLCSLTGIASGACGIRSPLVCPISHEQPFLLCTIPLAITKLARVYLGRSAQRKPAPAAPAPIHRNLAAVPLARGLLLLKAANFDDRETEVRETCDERMVSIGDATTSRQGCPHSFRVQSSKAQRLS